MDKVIQSILGDLYKLDPKLKKSEKDLVPLLQRLVDAKPDLKLDPGFVKKLRNQLMVRADELMGNEKPTQASWFSRFLAPLMGGTVALAALMIGLMVWNGNQTIKTESQFVPTEAQPFGNDQPEPIVAVPEPAPTPAPAPKAEPIAKPAQLPPKTAPKTVPKAPEETTEAPAPAPLMMQSLPAETGLGAGAPSLAPKAPLRTLDTAGAGVSNVGVDPIAYALASLKRAQAGERKITADSAQIGFRTPQELIGLNFDYLPEGFKEIANALPAGYRAFVDYAGRTPEYYIYFENTYQWYGPF